MTLRSMINEVPPQVRTCQVSCSGAQKRQFELAEAKKGQFKTGTFKNRKAEASPGAPGTVVRWDAL